MQKYIFGNWKSNKSLAEVHSWMQTWQKEATSIDKSIEVILGVPVIFLPFLHQDAPKNVHLGAQAVSPFPNGAYTGAISAMQLKEFGVRYALAGHSERRRYFHETDSDVANQATQLLENDITPIIAVEKKNWGSQLSQLSADQLKNSLVMYEPTEAISTSAHGHAADIEDVLAAVEQIASEFSVKGVLYGGSVNAENVQTYLQEEAIAGVVPGAASLNVHEFLQLIKAAGVKS